MSEQVELHHAFQWDCPECGRENFTRGVTLELDEDEQRELREEHGIEPWETGDWMQSPESVTCQFCKLKFETVRMFEGDDDDE